MSLVLSPGPAQYDPWKTIKSIGGANKGSTFGSRSKTIRVQEPTPGPGAYGLGATEKTLVRKAPGYSMSLKLGPTQAVYSGNPGPGGYEIYRPGTVGTGHAKTLSARYKTVVPENVPGPADYTPKYIEVLRDAAPAYTMPGRSVMIKPTFAPGPGAYNTAGDLMRANRGKTMSSRTATSHMENYPGPGAYTPKKIESCQPHAPVYTMAAHCGTQSVYASSSNPLYTDAQKNEPKAAKEGGGSRPSSAAGMRLQAMEGRLRAGGNASSITFG